ncbi:MAG: RNA methyltransferase [Candidatus Omnitrophica bacterium]|nr:RNA methyltransferase [Candidatus Omnitrophota bacterium]MDD5671775.1 RNA methyltransferase [Candidatus Omnitrophota bacterium]
MRKLSHQELVQRQQEKRSGKKLPFVAVLNNIRSLYNVGSVFRTADGVGLEKLWLCGITGIPPAGKISKTALGAEREMPWEYRQDVFALLRELRALGYEIVLLEQTVKSIPYETYQPSKPVCLVLGNEIKGVADDLLSVCDLAVEIEMVGLKNSLNVTVAFGVTAYHIRQQLLQKLPR